NSSAVRRRRRVMGPTWATSTPLRVTWKVSLAYTWSMTEAALLRNSRWVMVLLIQSWPFVSLRATPLFRGTYVVRRDLPAREGPAQVPWNVVPARRTGTTSTAEGAIRHEDRGDEGATTGGMGAVLLIHGGAFRSRGRALVETLHGGAKFRVPWPLPRDGAWAQALRPWSRARFNRRARSPSLRVSSAAHAYSARASTGRSRRSSRSPRTACSMG